MAIFLSILILMPAFVLTLKQAHTTWLWLALAFCQGLYSVIVAVLYWDSLVLLDDMWSSFASFFDGPSAWVQTSYFGRTAVLLVPLLFMALLLRIKAHPARTKLDVGLFWAYASLVLLAPTLIAMFSTPAQDGADLAAKIERALWVGRFLRWIAYAILLTAALRPILSWWRARKATDAV